MASLSHNMQPLLIGLSSACSDYSSQDGFGSMSPSIYDTAWLSMIQKPPGSGLWLFPACFDYILEHQLPSGAWESYATPIDGILNTSAAILALHEHLQLEPDSQDLHSRVQRAQNALGELLRSWDIASHDQIGFEVLIPKHLSLLAGVGIEFDMPKLALLQQLYEAKIAKLPKKLIYHAPSAILHSLEAFVGDIDFDRVRCWREGNGSMMGSPSSTAAYLINATEWDDKAEAYLRTVIERGSGKGNGSVPCAWPTSIFEVSWAITTLAQAGVPVKEVESMALSSFLENALSSTGCVGFAPSSVPDSDDTSKALMALMHLGKDVSVEKLVEIFESEKHFLTYTGERNPSITSNCNVLTCLCLLEDPLPYATQISKAAKFLCSCIYIGDTRDKWHHHDLYWMMLAAQALEHLYRRLQNTAGLLQHVIDYAPVLQEQLPLVSLKVLTSIVSSQKPDGSWDGICEPTAYAVLALASLAQLPWICRMLGETSITTSVEKAKSFLELAGESQWANGSYLWIEKISYSSSVLSRAYCEAALSQTVVRRVELDLHNAPLLLPERFTSGMHKAGKLVGQTPLFIKIDKDLLRAAEIQACYALSKLQQERLSIFPRKAMRKDTYLTFVPLTWTACNVLHGGKTSLYVLYEMMVVSMLVYQADEYMEGVVEKDLVEDLDLVKALIKSLFARINQESDTSPNGHNLPNGQTPQTESLEGLPEEKRMALFDARAVLQKFTTSILKHPAVVSRPANMQAQLAVELETFLLAHITQAEDNKCLGDQLKRLNGHSSTARSRPGEPSSSMRQHNIKPGRSFYSWVRSTSADHTSGPFAFVFFNCLIGSDIFARAKTAYVAEDLCRHLSSLCRMYNDYACVIRDAEEGNLNSTNFPVFHSRHDYANNSRRSGDTDVDEMQRVKDELKWIAEYERDGLNTAMGHLEVLLDHDGPDRDFLDALKLFVDVTDLYGLIYLIRDVSPRMK